MIAVLGFMPLDLYRSGDHYVLHADLPGADPGSVALSLDDGTLTIKAHRSGGADEDHQWISSERFTGTFRRQLSLGDRIDADNIRATYANGVLTVTIPVAAAARPRKIAISAGPPRLRVVEAAEQDQTRQEG